MRGVDDDTAAFDKVLEAMRMPRDSEKERAERAAAMRAGYVVATSVPLTAVCRTRGRATCASCAT